jgi:hypothetical protein
MHAAPPEGERAEASGLPGRKIDATPLSMMTPRGSATRCPGGLDALTVDSAAPVLGAMSPSASAAAAPRSRESRPVFVENWPPNQAFER